MTVITVVAAGYMRRVLPGGRETVVAGAAGADDLRVVDGKYGCPDIGRVAVLTDICRLNVSRALACRAAAVMAAYAIAGNTHVVETRRSPGGRRVTVVAGIAARDVRRVFARRNYAVMTGAAGANNLRVVDRKHGCEYIGRVTVLAHIAGLNMRRRIFASGIQAVMAVDTVTGDVQMVEVRR